MRLEIREFQTAVQKARQIGVHLSGDVRRAVDGIEDAPVGNADLKIVLIGAETAQYPVRDCDYFGIGFYARDTDQIRIELPVLADASALRALIAKDIGYGVPAGGGAVSPASVPLSYAPRSASFQDGGSLRDRRGQ